MIPHFNNVLSIEQGKKIATTHSQAHPDEKSGRACLSATAFCRP